MAQADRARRDAARAEDERSGGESSGDDQAKVQAQTAPEQTPGAQSQQPQDGGAASGGGTTQSQLDESHDARAEVDKSASPQSGRVPLPGTDLEPGGETGTTERPLAGIVPFGVAQAGGPDAHGQYVASDPHAYASIPGQTGVEAVGSGTPLLAEAEDAMRERANAGIPEPPKVGPVPNVTLLDTPGGYQVVPAGTSPEQIPERQASVRPTRGNYPQAPYGEEAGAENVPVAGPGAE